MLWTRRVVIVISFLFNYIHLINGSSDKIKITPKILNLGNGLVVNKTLENGYHLPSIRITFDLNNRKTSLLLFLRGDILTNNLEIFHQGDDKQIVSIEHKYNSENFCFYGGKVEGLDDSFATVSTCDGIKGIFSTGEFMYSIDNENGKDHFLILYEDDIKNFTSIERNFLNYPPSAMRLNSNRNSRNDLKMPYNANSDSYYVELCIVVDYDVRWKFNNDFDQINNFVINVVNIVNTAYNKLNIFVALIGIVYWDKEDMIVLSDDSKETLKNFVKYREEKLNKIIRSDNAQLITTKSFSDAVGITDYSVMCSLNNSCGVNVFLDKDPYTMARIIAHEMGHNFGMHHDSDACHCDYEICLMSEYTDDRVAMHWSSCSVQYLEKHLKTANVSCLKNQPQSLLENSFCGNGFVEYGEECDCGLPENCKSKCCNPLTCKLTVNSTCATGVCCNQDICSFHKPGTLCRKAESSCDLPEYCTGDVDFCPEDLMKADGESCRKGKGYCYHGLCGDRDESCRSFFGKNSYSIEDCYEYNKKGFQHANCDIDVRNENFVACTDTDKLCGSLQCYNTRYLIPREDIRIIDFAHGMQLECSSIFKDEYANHSHYSIYVENGAKCGDGKVCFNQRCMPVEDLKKSGRFPKCPHDCHGNGYCNDRGHCHCEMGYDPPDCYNPGLGGSIDSGPASHPKEGLNLTVKLFIALAIILPMTLIGFYIYRKFYNSKVSRHKGISIMRKFQLSQSIPQNDSQNSVRFEQQQLPTSNVPFIVKNPTAISSFASTDNRVMKPNRPAPLRPTRPPPPAPPMRPINATLSNDQNSATIHNNMVANRVQYFALKK